MFKLIILEKGIEILAQWLKSPKRDKIRAFLADEKTQNTVAEIFTAYASLVEEIEGEDIQ